MIVISPRTVIPENALEFSFSRSGGPGGQNVNKLNTRVTVRLNIATSDYLSSSEIHRISIKLSNRIDKFGYISLESSRHRTQGMNKEDAIEKLGILLRDALKVRKKRVRTKVPRKAHAKRLEKKQKRSNVKQNRRKPHDDM